MTEQAAQQPEDARPARVDLWRRLFAGQVTEVYVAGLDECVGRHLPQTLGLEPIFYRAYFHDREGLPTTNDQLARTARQLAAERRSIAGGGPWYWDREFAARAEAIVLFDLYDRWAHGRVDNDMGIRRPRRAS